MNDLRIIEGGGWFTATLRQFPRLAGYGKTPEDAERRLRLEIEARAILLEDELERLREVREAWEKDGIA